MPGILHKEGNTAKLFLLWSDLGGSTHCFFFLSSFVCVCVCVCVCPRTLGNLPLRHNASQCFVF
jgi:hypothetical protein